MSRTSDPALAVVDTRRALLPLASSIAGVLVALRPSPGTGLGRRRHGTAASCGRRREDRVSWPRDDAKLERVRALMAEHGLDALVVRAPDNVLYLTNFWGMKGYDVCVFPREGEPSLICLEAREATRSGRRGRPSSGFRRLRPARSAAADRACARARRGRVASTNASGSSWVSARRPPTAWSASRRRTRASGSTRSATRGRNAAPRRGAGDQDRPGDRADAARERDRRRGDGALHARAPAGHEGEPARREWNGFVHGEGTGWEGKVELARLLARLVGPGIRTFTATRRPAVEDEPTLFEIWVCADGYWCDHTKNLCPAS